ncbi:MAG: hypothetical protein ACLSDO_09090, partial [Anaerotruncus colihominis]
LTPASEEDAGQAVDPLLSRPDDFAEEQVDEPAGESFESGLKQPPQKRDPNRRLNAREGLLLYLERIGRANSVKAPAIHAGAFWHSAAFRRRRRC